MKAATSWAGKIETEGKPRARGLERRTEENGERPKSRRIKMAENLLDVKFLDKHGDLNALVLASLDVRLQRGRELGNDLVAGSSELEVLEEAGHDNLVLEQSETVTDADPRTLDERKDAAPSLSEGCRRRQLVGI